MAQMTSSTRMESLARMHPRTEIVDGLDDILDSDGRNPWLGMDHRLGMDPRLGMIRGSDDILDSDGFLGSEWIIGSR
jgi:hypothetical protein